MKVSKAMVLGFAFSSAQLHYAVARSSQGIRLSNTLRNVKSASTAFAKYNSTSLFPRADPPPPPSEPPPSPPWPILELADSASDAVWEKALCKGSNFLRAMHGTDAEAGQLFNPPRSSAASPVTDIEDTEKWGWETRFDLLNEDFTDWGMDDILDDLGLSSNSDVYGGSIQCTVLSHGYDVDSDGEESTYDFDEYMVDGRMYRKTGAHYGFGIQPKQGVILAMDRLSPQLAGQKRDPKVEGSGLPAVSSSSDAAWVLWNEYAKDGADIKNLKYFFSLSIGNEDTQGIVARAIRNKIPNAREVPRWEGYEFLTDTPEGQALLGSPNLLAFSYLLIQHKAELGNLYITKIRVFRDERYDSALNMALFVERAPPPADPMDVDNPNQEASISQIFPNHPNRGAGTAKNAAVEPIVDTAWKNRTHLVNLDAPTVNTTAVDPGNLPPASPLTVPPKPWPGQEGGYLELYQDAFDDEWEKAKCKGQSFPPAPSTTKTSVRHIANQP
ncbi:hypothetical protein OPT61_g8743 [Boeremia exigua]|uniref:Uncharacterized protein n=1 Tax=Boeremia exigua TaxID=749465 RepID=A0ACC2HWZ6_9PLEO|nr:hypothetical protein OPT61_g8743 [Boeremia exigua]